MICDNLNYAKENVDAHPLIKDYFGTRISCDDFLKNLKAKHKAEIQELRAVVYNKKLKLNFKNILFITKSVINLDNEKIFGAIVKVQKEENVERYNANKDFIFTVIDLVKSHKKVLKEAKDRVKKLVAKKKWALKNAGYNVLPVQHAYDYMKSKVSFYIKNNLDIEDNGLSTYAYLDDFTNAFAKLQIMKIRKFATEELKRKEQEKALKAQEELKQMKEFFKGLNEEGIQNLDRLVGAVIENQEAGKKISAEEKKELKLKTLEMLGFNVKKLKENEAKANTAERNIHWTDEQCFSNCLELRKKRKDRYLPDLTKMYPKVDFSSLGRMKAMYEDPNVIKGIEQFLGIK